MRRLLLLVGLVPLLTGCLYLPLVGGSSSSGSSAASSAQSNVRAAIPAIEAYYADNGTYVGMTVRKLRATYDYGIPPDLEIVRAMTARYCVQNTVAGETYSYHGPGGPLARGGC
jgi:hypothetical protein